MLSGRVGRLDISSGHQMKKYRTPGKVPKSNRKIVERDKVVTLSTHIHDLSCSGTFVGSLIIIYVYLTPLAFILLT
jgi:hypothetical protein